MSKIPQSVRIIIAMLLGLLGGYYFALFPLISAVADGFIMLLQMTALPYIALSLIVGIATLSMKEAKSALGFSLLALVGLTALSLVFILLSPIAFPNWENASFYSANIVKTEHSLSFIDLFIPKNPFNAFANGIIPSVVLFSVFIGIGLMTVKGKRHTLFVMSNLLKSLANANALIMRFAPIGVLCIGYRASATINATQLDGLVVYISTTFTLVALITFLIFPVTVAMLTPFRYRQVIAMSREAMITAFATGSFFAVIPLVVEKTKRAIEELSGQEKQTEKVPGIIVPITYSLPVGGKLLALLFTMFAAWFSGAYIGFNDYLKLIFLGIPQLFGTSTIAIPELLALFNVSNSMFELFLIAENLIISRLGAVLSVTFAFCFPLLIAAKISGNLKIHWRYVFRNALIIPVVSVIAFITLKTGLEHLSLQYKGYEKFIDRDHLFQLPPSTDLKSATPDMFELQPLSVLRRINARGFIRVGYFRDDLPYSFHNKEGKLVGFDIEILKLLAKDLDISIEFVRIYHDQASELLASGYLDMTTGIPVIPDNMSRYTLTIPYTEQSVALIVKDERRAEFTQWQTLISNKDLILGVPETFFYRSAIIENFDKSKVWEISTPRLFFKEEYQHIDGMIFGAAAASAWTLLYPDYTVVIPTPKLPPLNMAFPINENDLAFELFMRNWINMKTQSGVFQQLFSYWIEGKSPENIIPTN